MHRNTRDSCLENRDLEKSDRLRCKIKGMTGTLVKKYRECKKQFSKR
jgi:hypothetical protein